MLYRIPHFGANSLQSNEQTIRTESRSTYIQRLNEPLLSLFFEQNKEIMLIFTYLPENIIFPALITHMT